MVWAVCDGCNTRCLPDFDRNDDIRFGDLKVFSLPILRKYRVSLHHYTAIQF